MEDFLPLPLDFIILNGNPFKSSLISHCCNDFVCFSFTLSYVVGVAEDEIFFFLGNPQKKFLCTGPTTKQFEGITKEKKLF